MYSIFKIQDTVLKVSIEAKLLMPEIQIIKNENKLLHELVLCILSSQEKYEVALAIMKVFKKNNILRIPLDNIEFKKNKNQIRHTLNNPVNFLFNNKDYFRRLRFFHKKGNYIIDTLENIYLNNLTINKILKQNNCSFETRKNIIKYSHGLGPKQASMFLRNIGFYSEFAVLDKHVIDYMRIMGLTCIKENSFSSLTSYEKIENIFIKYAESINVNLLHLDLAIWTTMRTLNNYQK